MAWPLMFGGLSEWCREMCNRSIGRVTCLIDSLVSGGAQRQICMLAILLKRHGVDVRIVTYYPFDFFKAMLTQSHIDVTTVHWHNKLQRTWAVRQSIRSGRPDVVIAYLATPSVIAELAGLPFRDYLLIVSERNLDSPKRFTIRRRIEYFLHFFADAVVTNSYSQAAIMQEMMPRLARRTTTILNAVDTKVFRPAKSAKTIFPNELSIVCVGSFRPQKNYAALLEAVEILWQQRPELTVWVDVYGRSSFSDETHSVDASPFVMLQESLVDSPVNGRFRLHPPKKNVVPLYNQADCLCLPSLYEGCANVIGEAMACGRPVLASRVSDNGLLVQEGVTGILFDPTDSADIADAILRFAQLSIAERIEMGRAARERAEILLAPDRLLQQYIDLIHKLQTSAT